MKKINIIKSVAAIAITAGALSSCTKGFEEMNTNPDAVQTVDNKSYITTMEMDAIIPCSDITANDYQRAANLMGDTFGGYFAPTQAFNGGAYTVTYDLDATSYNDYAFKVAYTQVMPAWLSLKYAYQNEQIGEEMFAIAEVIKVMTLQRVSDIYGPLPVSHFGEDVNPYESQEDVYKNLIKDLDKAIDILKIYAAMPITGTAPLAAVDAIYQGDYAMWLKLANSQKLRMAMRIRFVEPALAQKMAEEAVTDGVMTKVSDSALLKTSGNVAVYNPIEEVWNAYTDTRMNATMDSYLNGYADPRLAKFFKESTIEEGGFHGVRAGIRYMQKDDYLKLSSPNITKSTPVVWMLASESAFNRAEGAILGWNMGADAATLYNQGIALSFEENGLSAGDATEYGNSENTPIAFEDKSRNGRNSYSKHSEITPKWNEEAGMEEKLERIITQKWIAMYPNGQEAWSEFRRTGYPRIIPVKDNLSGGTINTEKQIRRMTFPRSEYANNAAEIKKATALLGGQDNGGTKLWWDAK